MLRAHAGPRVASLTTASGPDGATAATGPSRAVQSKKCNREPSSPSSTRAMWAALSSVPLPIVLTVGTFLFLLLVIIDTGAGAPIFWPLVRPFCRPFEASLNYRRIKSKYSIS